MRKTLQVLVRQMAEQFVSCPASSVPVAGDVAKPFAHLKISSWEPLKNVVGRSNCPVCGRSRKFYCYTCYVLVGIHDNHLIPTVKLPVKVNIIKHPLEVVGKSTATHARILAPDDVTIHIYPDIPTYSDTSKVLLLFPKESALSTSELVHKLQTQDFSRQLPGTSQSHTETNQSDASYVSPSNSPWGCIDTLVVIDSTWNQTNAILRDDRVKGLPCVKLGEAETHFWRPQSKSDKHLATIEAIYYFFREMAQLSDSRPYGGHYDNLLYFYAYQYGVVQQAMQEKRTLEIDSEH